MFNNHFSSIKVTIIIHIKIIIYERQLYSELDLLWIRNLKNTLGRPLVPGHVP
jgi:hypothetical protein